MKFFALTALAGVATAWNGFHEHDQSHCIQFNGDHLSAATLNYKESFFKYMYKRTHPTWHYGQGTCASAGFTHKSTKADGERQGLTFSHWNYTN